MSERYNSRRVKREWVAALASGAHIRDPRDEVEKQAAFERRQTLKKLEGNTRSIPLCTHNAPWLDCRVCSKPRNKP
jgi:hypothetical protein